MRTEKSKKSIRGELVELVYIPGKRRPYQVNVNGKGKWFELHKSESDYYFQKACILS